MPRAIFFFFYVFCFSLTSNACLVTFRAPYFTLFICLGLNRVPPGAKLGCVHVLQNVVAESKILRGLALQPKNSDILGVDVLDRVKVLR